MEGGYDACTMAKAKTKESQATAVAGVAEKDFEKLLETESFTPPQIGDTVEGTVISASKSEVKLDIAGVIVGVVRGKELYRESPEYANLKPGDTVEATVIETENENGEMELSFSYAGHQKAWAALKDALENKKIIPLRVREANKGGLMVSYGQIMGFLPVSQLAPENYPRVSGGDKGKILEKLREFVGNDIDVKILDLDEQEEKMIASEKLAWSEKQKDVINQYDPGTVVEGTVTAVTSFGVFISFGEGLEGLIHISELAWQRIENPADHYKVGDTVKAQVINVDGAKIFLSIKRLLKDPWQDVREKYSINDKVKGEILKINPFGLFVKLDDDIHALAHVSALGLKSGERMEDRFTPGEEAEFYIISMEPEAHRLGLSTSPTSKKAKTEDKKAASKDGKESSAPADGGAADENAAGAEATQAASKTNDEHAAATDGAAEEKKESAA